MGKITDKIFNIGLVPLVVLDDASDAVDFAKALVKGSIPIAEVTFRTSAAVDTIKAMAENVPEIIVGAGTVHTVQQAKDAVNAGAQFIVTPGFNCDVVKWCVDNDVEVLPGTVSPADLELALSFGLKNCKFFPAEAYGGVKTLKALAGPYSGIKFMPTGGVNENNMREYLNLPNVGAVGGSFMAPNNLVKEKKWDEISSLCQKTVYKMLGFKLAHVGINTESEKDALFIANMFSNMFGQSINETDGAYFAGDMVEVVKGSFLGTKGHIAISTCDIVRAKAYLESIGVNFNEKTASYDEKGKLVSIYLEDEIGGFAVHLRRE